VGVTRAAALSELATAVDKALVQPTPAALGRPVALLLPGQGAQHRLMAAGLYGTQPVFTAVLDEVFALMGEEGAAVRRDWLAESPELPIEHTGRSQRLLFAIEYALVRMLLAAGIRPSALLGHSVGEFAAATLADVFGLADALRVLEDRVARMSVTPPGGMLAVAASAADLEPFLRDGVVVGGINGPGQVLLAGPATALANAEKSMREEGFTVLRIRATHAFHSPVVAPAAAASGPLIARMPRRPPEIPLYSAYTGRLLDEQSLADPMFWAMQPAAPVMFGQALDALLASGPYLLVDTGPGQGLATLARRHPAVRAGRSTVTALLPARVGTAEADRGALCAAMAGLWMEGHEPQWPNRIDTFGESIESHLVLPRRPDR
jgi:acyl transferase domain-containing protein